MLNLMDTAGRISSQTTSAASSQGDQNLHSNSSSTDTSSSSYTTARSQLLKRSRGVGVVTPNACTECRRKHAKCDGQTPCARCRTGNAVRCVYKGPVRQPKKGLRIELESLRRHAHCSEQIFAALARSNAEDKILSSLRGDYSIEAVSGWLERSLTSNDPRSISSHSSPQQSWSHSQAFPSQNGDSRSAALSWMSKRYGSTHTRIGSRSESPQLVNVDRDISELTESEPESSVTWTSITTDTDLVTHLLALYFSWEYPTFATLSKEHFLRDFQSGHRRYCSPVLVNALLALACRFSSRPMARAHPSDPSSSGDHFFEEALRLFSQRTDHHSLTTIQALGIMSIREASCGRDSESRYYAGQSARLVIEMGLHRVTNEGDADEVAVRSATFWGAFALDHAWALTTGSLPQFSHSLHYPPKPATINDIEASLWVPYTDDNAALQRTREQLSNVRSVYKCFCELNQLAHQSLYLMHSSAQPLTAKGLISTYTQYLTWYDQIPEVLRLGHNFTPAVIFTHMYFHFAILLLFRPLVKLRIFGSNVLPRDVCIQAAFAIQGLVKSYSQLYTLRRTPSFVPYFVLASATMQLSVIVHSTHSNSSCSIEQHTERRTKLDAQVSEAISQSIRDLAEMAACHHFAKKALNILRYIAKQWDADFDVGSSKSPSGYLDKIVQPHPSKNFTTPRMKIGDLLSGFEGVRGATLSPGSIRKPSKAADSIEKLLLWPYHKQGRLMMPTEGNLEHSGFAIL